MERSELIQPFFFQTHVTYLSHRIANETPKQHSDSLGRAWKHSCKCQIPFSKGCRDASWPTNTITSSDFENSWSFLFDTSRRTEPTFTDIRESVPHTRCTASNNSPFWAFCSYRPMRPEMSHTQRHVENNKWIYSITYDCDRLELRQRLAVEESMHL